MKTIYERSGRAYFTSFAEKSLLLCAYHFSPRYGTIKLYFYKEEHTVKKQLLFRRFPAVLLALLTSSDSLFSLLYFIGFTTHVS